MLPLTYFVENGKIVCGTWSDGHICTCKRGRGEGARARARAIIKKKYLFKASTHYSLLFVRSWDLNNSIIYTPNRMICFQIQFASFLPSVRRNALAPWHFLLAGWRWFCVSTGNLLKYWRMCIIWKMPFLWCIVRNFLCFVHTIIAHPPPSLKNSSAPNIIP